MYYSMKNGKKDIYPSSCFAMFMYIYRRKKERSDTFMLRLFPPLTAFIICLGFRLFLRIYGEAFLNVQIVQPITWIIELLTL